MSLPVELISFEGKLTDNQNVDLKWVTASEINNDYFTIESSVDGLKFNALGTQKGAGNSFNISNYTFTDISPLHGLSYYRIRQTDFNGDFDFSNVITIRNYSAAESKADVLIYPNPFVNNIVYLNILDHTGETFTISITDVFGKTLMQKQIVLRNSNISIYLYDMHGNKLPAGLYAMQINMKDNVFQQKPIIK